MPIKKDPVVHAVAACLELYGSKLAGRPLYVACSGGRDSLSLAHLCVSLAEQGRMPKPILLHVNHHLQSEAGTWACIVSAFAQQFGLVCHIVSVELSDDSEKTARDARYKAFFGVMAEGGVLLLAHHADDQAETLLMRLIAGTGLQGLTGMKAWSERTYQGKQLFLCRPLLSATRHQISDYAHAHALPYVDDPTNEAGDNRRAVLRRTVMPALAALNPKAAINIARTASLISPIYEDLAHRTASALALCQDTANTGFCTAGYVAKLSITALFELDELLQTSVIRAFIQGDEPLSAPSDFVERVLALVKRSDTNHETVLFWRGTQKEGYVFVRYDAVLYRHQAVFWAALKAAFEPTGSELVSTAYPHIRLPLDLLEPHATFVPVSKQDRVMVNSGKKAYCHKKPVGKKLYQTLRIPPWYRPHLWVMYANHKALVGIDFLLYQSES